MVRMQSRTHKVCAIVQPRLPLQTSSEHLGLGCSNGGRDHPSWSTALTLKLPLHLEQNLRPNNLDSHTKSGTAKRIAAAIESPPPGVWMSLDIHPIKTLSSNHWFVGRKKAFNESCTTESSTSFPEGRSTSGFISRRTSLIPTKVDFASAAVGTFTTPRSSDQRK
jgi:hypothetical protein